MHHPLKWSPAHHLRKPDNIISSLPKPVFEPLYLHEPTENINYLLSHEYMRMWFKEKEVYDKNFYIREQIIREETKIKRRGIQRMQTYRRPSKNQFIDEYVERKVGISNENDQRLNKKKMKYKPVCSKRTKDNTQAKTRKVKIGSKQSEASTGNKHAEENEESDNGCEIVVRQNCCQSRQK